MYGIRSHVRIMPKALGEKCIYRGEFNLLVLSHFISVHLPFRPRSRRRGFTLPELKWQPTSSEVEELEEQQNYGISSNRLRRVMEGPHP
ncbi:hypothetical protein Y032_0238g3299 [Ancylostoma ceylanicum]|uniref:Uncharacterized protein n=1 Tax=Ancylostoma ceylanicum TaxID=53326 RepID=A0A016SF78_9BILA|nr:hypothetical protein Y032_0238g3299 [Ancylostoma ceylanicum]